MRCLSPHSRWPLSSLLYELVFRLLWRTVRGCRLSFRDGHCVSPSPASPGGFLNPARAAAALAEQFESHVVLWGVFDAPELVCAVTNQDHS